MLEIASLTKVYGGEGGVASNLVLDAISFTVPPWKETERAS
jgi:hypothetical protein